MGRKVTAPEVRSDEALRARGGKDSFFATLPAVRRYRSVKALGQFILIEWLTKKAHRSGPQRTYTDGFFRKRGHENHGQGSAVRDQVILQFQTA